jgi:hypothetical protein
MRQSVMLAAVVLSAVSGAQPVAEKPKASLFPLDEKGHAYFQEVVAVEGTPQAELYTRAKVWSANAYQSANNVTQWVPCITISPSYPRTAPLER